MEILSVLETDVNFEEIVCFGECIGQVHSCLEEAYSKCQNLTGFLADLSTICISMTQKEPSSRPTSSQVLDSIQQKPDYSCVQCATKHVPGNSRTTKDIIGNQTDLVSVSTVGSSTIPNSISDTRLGRTEMFGWMWSPPHNDYYYVTKDPYGMPFFNSSIDVTFKLIKIRQDSLPLG